MTHTCWNVWILYPASNILNKTKLTLKKISNVCKNQNEYLKTTTGKQNVRWFLYRNKLAGNITLAPFSIVICNAILDYFLQQNYF